ncbi:hypothetical protein T235_11380 [Tannerella sp. oral taxon BU063 isolate Cell 8/11]|uniref:Uncharacterized protein n=1 Tax=Tannerella sp. oral taxon BU063 isolate Cell 8/11 TaxID=1411915 RepID=W2D079_9BACT|nr:hypothetical protein T235_11380 [Tannerella sp. oral taxon BU063 isolate Cell 8/11]
MRDQAEKGTNILLNFCRYLDAHRLIFATKGKGEEAFDEFVKELESRGARRKYLVR